MGNPVNFDGVNVVLRAATGDENVQDMGAFRNHAACVSCWELDREEIEEITRTGRVFLSVLMGGSQPPVAVGSETRIRGLMLDFGPVWPAPVNTPPETNVDVDAEIASVVQSVNEWDDRTSPDDYPDHLLITSEELGEILRNFADTLRGRNDG